MASANTNTDILLAGAFAAFSVDLLVYPLDTIKTRLQSADYKRLYTNTANGTVNRTLFRGLYQGIGSVIFATVPSSGAFFTTYEATKTLLHPLPLPLPLVNSLASSTGELISCLILTPAEVLKQNAQMVVHPAPHSSSSPNHPPRLFDRTATALALRKFSSPTHLWRGYTALVSRNLPFTAMHFPLFEHLRVKIREHRHRTRTATTSTSQGAASAPAPPSLLENTLVTALSASTAGSMAALLTTPIDVIKTRIMLSASESGPSSHSPPRNSDSTPNSHSRPTTQPKSPAANAAAPASSSGSARASMWAVGKEVFEREGMRGLMRGGGLRAVWTAVGSGLYLGVYEGGRGWLEGRRRREGEGGGW